jgi:hypothetical protein
VAQRNEVVAVKEVITNGIKLAAIVIAAVESKLINQT